MAHATKKKTDPQNPDPSDLNAKGLKASAIEIQSDLKVGQTESAAVKADGVIHKVRASVAKNGADKTVAIAVEAGATEKQGRALAAMAAASRQPPSGIVKAMVERSIAMRRKAIRKAVCSVETSRWVDGLLDTNDPETRRNQRELVAEAVASGDLFTCLLIAARIATRQVRAEFVTKLALYALSKAFIRDAKRHAKGDQGPDADELRDLFIGMEKVLDETADPTEITRFTKALASRMEQGLGLPEDSAWRLLAAGPDAMAALPEEEGPNAIGIAYGTANDSAEKAVSTAGTMRRDWQKLRKAAGLIRMFFAGCPIVLGDASRMQNDGEALAPLAADMARLQVAHMLLTTLECGIVECMLAGKVVAEGLYFSTGEPVELGADLFEDTKKSILAVAANGYPGNHGRGNEMWLTLMGTISAWATNWPETFPWFGNKELIDWIDGNPHLIRNESVRSSAAATSGIVGKTREHAIAQAERIRKEYLATQEAEAPLVEEKVMSRTMRQFKTLIKRYAKKGSSRRSLNAMLADKDVEGIRMVYEENKNPRKVRGRNK